MADELKNGGNINDFYSQGTEEPRTGYPCDEDAAAGRRAYPCDDNAGDAKTAYPCDEDAAAGRESYHGGEDYAGGEADGAIASDNEPVKPKGKGKRGGNAAFSRVIHSGKSRYGGRRDDEYSSRGDSGYRSRGEDRYDGRRDDEYSGRGDSGYRSRGEDRYGGRGSYRSDRYDDQGRDGFNDLREDKYSDRGTDGYRSRGRDGFSNRRDDRSGDRWDDSGRYRRDKSDARGSEGNGDRRENGYRGRTDDATDGGREDRLGDRRRDDFNSRGDNRYSDRGTDGYRSRRRDDYGNSGDESGGYRSDRSDTRRSERYGDRRDSGYGDRRDRKDGYGDRRDRKDGYGDRGSQRNSRPFETGRAGRTGSGRFEESKRKPAVESVFSNAYEVTVESTSDVGAFVKAPEAVTGGNYGTSISQNVLLPFSEQIGRPEKGERVTVRFYEDKGGRLTCTMRTPYLNDGEVGRLKVAAVTNIGAFLDNGVPKQVLLPFKEQIVSPEVGDEVLVWMYKDKSGRQAASMRVYAHLSRNSPYKEDDWVTGFVYEVNPKLGVFVAVDDKYYGLVPIRETFTVCEYGDEIEARVAKVREDGKLDLLIRDKLYKTVEQDADVILYELRRRGGFLPYGDRADPRFIESTYAMSKNQFKRALGHLYKNHMVELDRVKDTVTLIKADNSDKE